MYNARTSLKKKNAHTQTYIYTHHRTPTHTPASSPCSSCGIHTHSVRERCATVFRTPQTQKKNKKLKSRMKFIVATILSMLVVSHAVEIKDTKANEASKKFLQEYAEREVRCSSRNDDTTRSFFTLKNRRSNLPLHLKKTTISFTSAINTGYRCPTVRFDVPCFGTR